MQDLWDALFPSGATASNTLTWIFTAVIFTVTAIAILVVLRQRRMISRRIARLHDVLTAVEQSPDRSRAHGDEVEDAALKGLWQEYDETLLWPERPDDGSLPQNTVEADAIFNERTLASGLSGNRLLLAVPGVLTALGLLGTFLGLVLGLSGLHDANAVASTANADALLDGIDAMIGGAGAAFITSVWGVVGSILVNLIEKTVEGRVATNISRLQTRIDGMFRRATPEESLIAIQRASYESQLALQTLDERIGDRLQTSVEGLSEAVYTSITNSIGPAMEEIVKRSSTQSTEVFESLVQRFTESFTSIGTKQAQALNDASARLSERIDQMGSIVAELQRSATTVLPHIQVLSTTLEKASAHVDTAASSLDRASTRIEETSSAIGGLLDRAAANLETVQARSEMSVASISAASDAIRDAASKLVSATSGASETSTALAAQLERFGTLQQEFQANLRSDVDSLSNSMSNWLNEYASDVEKQLTDRMTLWNTVSQSYANEMLSVAQALHEVMQEIEDRSRAPREADGPPSTNSRVAETRVEVEATA